MSIVSSKGISIVWINSVNIKCESVWYLFIYYNFDDNFNGKNKWIFGLSLLFVNGLTEGIESNGSLHAGVCKGDESLEKGLERGLFGKVFVKEKSVGKFVTCILQESYIAKRSLYRPQLLPPVLKSAFGAELLFI